MTKEMSKEEVKLQFVYCASSECINYKGSVVDYSHRNDLVIEIQLLATQHLVFCLGMRNNELIWRRLTCNFCVHNHCYGLVVNNMTSY